MVVEEIPRLVRMLRCLMLSIPVSRYRFDLHFADISGGPPKLEFQRLVLEPFRLLTGTTGVSIGGAVDQNYTRSIRECMESQICWIRGLGWEMFDFAVSLKSIGDEAFNMGNWDAASDFYSNCRMILLIPKLFQNHKLGSISENLLKSIEQTSAVIYSNLILANVRRKYWDWIINLDGAGQLRLLNPSYVNLYQAIALAAKHEDLAALVQLREAAKLDPDNDLFASFTEHMEACIDTTHGIKRSPIEPIFSDQWLSRLRPHESPRLVKIPSARITAERYLLRHLRYEGDLMADIAEMGSFDKQRLDEVLRNIERERAMYPPGTRVRIEIGKFPNFVVVPL